MNEITIETIDYQINHYTFQMINNQPMFIV